MKDIKAHSALNNDKADQARQRGNDLTSGRKFTADELQLMLLQFLADAPAHGYELIKRFNDVSGGYYSPSPGMLYPALAELEAQGYTRAERKGRRKSYHLTPSGHAFSKANAQRSQYLLATLSHAAKKMLWMRHVSDSMVTAADATGWLPEFVQTRKALQAALLTQSDASHDDQRRIIAILQRAITDILQNITEPTEPKP